MIQLDLTIWNGMIERSYEVELPRKPILFVQNAKLCTVVGKNRK